LTFHQMQTICRFGNAAAMGATVTVRRRLALDPPEPSTITQDHMTDAAGQMPDGPISETPDGVTFADLGLSPALLEAVTGAGYTKPTPIQWKAIPKVLEARDVLGIAQTGTGKTASFVLPMIEVLSQGRAKARMPRTLILEPTRELAAQVAENFEKYGKNHKLTMALLIGGVSFGDQDALLTKGVDVLIATPGRLLDHFERGKLLLSGVQMLVVDEADRMLDMGFIPDIERIVKLTPFTRQTLFFSATMPPEIQRLTEQFLQAPVRVEVARPAQAAATITQNLVKVPAADPKTKRTALRAVVAHCMETIKNAIIFCNRKTDVDIVAKSLAKYGFDAAPIHGDLAQSQRTATLDKFRAGELKLLVASDVAARGLDIPDVSHVFNFDVPRNSEDYVHRIGRTGRAGRLGEAFMLVTPADSKSLDGVQSLIKTQIPYVEIVGVPTERVPDEFAGRRERPERAPRRDRDRSQMRDRPVAPKPDDWEYARTEPLKVVALEGVADDAGEAAAPVELVDAPAPELHSSSRRRERGDRGDRGDRAGRGDRGDRGERPARADRQPREASGEQAERPDRDGRRERHGRERDRDERPVLAFGGDTPAFMLRKVFADA
jgi:superfamily II DNA/RNA helicase